MTQIIAANFILNIQRWSCSSSSLCAAAADYKLCVTFSGLSILFLWFGSRLWDPVPGRTCFVFLLVTRCWLRPSCSRWTSHMKRFMIPRTSQDQSFCSGFFSASRSDTRMWFAPLHFSTFQIKEATERTDECNKRVYLVTMEEQRRGADRKNISEAWKSERASCKYSDSEMNLLSLCSLLFRASLFMILPSSCCFWFSLRLY